MKQIVIIMSIISMLFGKASQDSAIMVLSPTEYKAQIENAKVQLVDVRTPKEYKSGHIKNAQNIDFYSPSFANQFEKIDKEKPVYVYCRSGMRSAQASKKLVAMGFKEIYDLKGGFLNWK